MLLSASGLKKKKRKKGKTRGDFSEGCRLTLPVRNGLGRNARYLFCIALHITATGGN